MKNINYGSRTDRGRVREHNEDSLVVHAPLFAVADGMGGHEAGEIASEIAVETLATQAPDTVDSRELGRAVMAANRAVMRGAANGIGKPGMGTTMTAALLVGTKLAIAQVGDSRAYLLHQGEIKQVTHDHSLVAELVDEGKITAEEARWHPQRSVITRALGSDPEMIPDLFDLDLENGDRVLLCSDGLSGMLTDDELRKIMVEQSDPQTCADRLIDAANAAGGTDNITAIVMDVSDGTEAVVEKKRSHKTVGIFLAFAVAIVAALVLGGVAVYSYARSSAYLIAEDGYVTVYRGLLGGIGDLRLSWLETKTAIPVDKLNDVEVGHLETGIQVGSLDDAFATVENYATEAGLSQTGSSQTGSATIATASSTAAASSSVSDKTSTSSSSASTATTKTGNAGA